SSRRRHTRFSRDWSSDVCSSDLAEPGGPLRRAQGDPGCLGRPRGREALAGEAAVSPAAASVAESTSGPSREGTNVSLTPHTHLVMFVRNSVWGVHKGMNALFYVRQTQTNACATARRSPDA